jgi:hypothetical protein
MCATEHPVPYLYSMPNNAAGTMTASWRDRLDRTLEAVERMPLPFDVNFKALVVLVAANFASGHRHSSD